VQYPAPFRATIGSVRHKKFAAYLGVHDCEVDFQDAESVRYVNRRTGYSAAVPANAVLDPITVRAACHSLDVPPPPEVSERSPGGPGARPSRGRKARA
jgi:hypothetical protein